MTTFAEFVLIPHIRHELIQTHPHYVNNAYLSTVITWASGMELTKSKTVELMRILQARGLVEVDPRYPTAWRMSEKGAKLHVDTWLDDEERGERERAIKASRRRRRRKRPDDQGGLV